MGLSVISAQGLAADQLLGGEKNGIVYRSFCIVMTIVIITNSSSIYSIALLNCLYLNPWVFPFVHFFSPSCWEGGGGVSEQLSGAYLPAARLNHDRVILRIHQQTISQNDKIV